MSQSGKGFSEATVQAPSPCREMRGAGMFFAKNLLISAFIEPRKRRLSLLYLGGCPGVGSCIKNIGLRIISKPAATLPVRICVVQGRGNMCHEHPNIFVVNRQTYETYRFTVAEDGALAHDEPRSNLGEARRTAIAFLTRSEKERAPRR